MVLEFILGVTTEQPFGFGQVGGQKAIRNAVVGTAHSKQKESQRHSSRAVDVEVARNESRR